MTNTAASFINKEMIPNIRKSRIYAGHSASGLVWANLTMQDLADIKKYFVGLNYVLTFYPTMHRYQITWGDKKCRT